MNGRAPPAFEGRLPVVPGEQHPEVGHQGLGEGDRLLDVATEGLVFLVLLRVLRQRLLQVVGQRRVGDEEPVLLAAERAVDPGQGLHEQRTLERPVEVERV